MSCFVWLGSFLDGSSRVRPPHADAGTKRVRRILEPADWLCDRLQQQGGKDFHKDVLFSFQTAIPSDELKVCALLRISDRSCVFEQGPLTNWDCEANLQRMYYGLPSDCYSLRIEDVHECVDDISINHKRSRVCGLGGLSRIDRNHPLFLAHWGGVPGNDGDSQSSAGQVLLRTQAGEQMCAQAILDANAGGYIAGELPVILLPFPLAYLAKKGSWSNILILLRWHSTLHQHRHRRAVGPIPTWPPGDAEVWQNLGQHRQPPDEDDVAQALPLSAESLERFARVIRGWAPLLLNDPEAPEQDPEAVQHDVQLVLTTLDRWSFSWRQAMGMVNLAGGGTRFRHNSRKLLDCIRLSFLVKGGPSSLSQVIAQSLATVLPEFLREPFVRNVCKQSGTNILPSASLVSRYEIALDAALMLVAKQRAAHACIRVGWTDSSPLAGYDWIWPQYHEIQESKLLRCFQSVCKLCAAISDFVAEHHEQEIQEGNDEVDEAPQELPTSPLPEWKPLLQVISDSIHEHIHPPAALGSGHRSLADKAASEVFKWQLQSPSIPNLTLHSASYVAHCSDMGVELSLPDFELSGSVDRLLPEWMREVLPADVDAADDVASAAEAADDVDGAFLDHNDADVAQGVANPPANVGAHETEAARGTVRFMPQAFPVAGMQHIVDNLCSDVHQGMSHWSNFHSDLKALEALLRIDERRQRFVWTCLHGTNLEGQSIKFRKFSASLYEGRWHQVIVFLKHLQPVLPILARAWDKDNYLRGVNANGALRPVQVQAEQAQHARQGLVALDPDRISVAVQSSLFHSYVAMALKLEQVPEALASASEACVCHRQLFRKLSDHRRRKCLEEHFGQGCSVCPMAGKLLPELVAGELELSFEGVCSLQEDDLRLLPLPGLPALTVHEWNTLISDFRKGPGHSKPCQNFL